MGEKTTNVARGYPCIRLLIILTLLVNFAALMVACGGGARKQPVAPIVPETNPAVDEVQNTPLPEGIDADVWAALTTELVSVLEGITADDRDPVEFNWDISGVGVAWRNEFMRPDGNNDARVDVLDLVPLAEHFGEEWADGVDGPVYADYESDNVIDLADIGPVARNYGLTCSGFQVELSSESAEDGFTVAGTVGYGEYFDLSSATNSRSFRFPCETRGLEPLWVRVTVLGEGGEQLASQVWAAPVVTATTPPRSYTAAFQPDIRPLLPLAITWSTRYLMPDGNQDGIVNEFDAGALRDWWGSVAEEPMSAVADYNCDGDVDTGDLPAVTVHYGSFIDYFVVEVSLTSPDDGFTEICTVGYFDSIGFNEFGFRYYEYEFDSPSSNMFWARVVPYGLGGDTGEPSEALVFNGAEFCSSRSLIVVY